MAALRLASCRRGQLRSRNRVAGKYPFCATGSENTAPGCYRRGKNLSIKVNMKTQRKTKRTRRTATRIGRPTKYTSAVAQKICKNIAEGCSREASASLAGISTATLYEWQRQFPQFSEGLEKADARCERECITAIRKAGRSSRNWTASAWCLERKFPHRYGRVDRHLIHATSGATPLPQDYIAAINEALGVRGKLEPLNENLLTEHSGNGHGTIDVTALPEDVLDLEILPQD